MSLFDRLRANPHVELGPLGSNVFFKEFLEELPLVLGDLMSETLTLQTLMHAQYLCLDALIERSLGVPKILSKLRQSVSQYEHAVEFLSALGITAKDYCQRTPGMSDQEFSQMEQGRLRVSDLLRSNPAVYLAPLLRKSTKRH